MAEDVTPPPLRDRRSRHPRTQVFGPVCRSPRPRPARPQGHTPAVTWPHSCTAVPVDKRTISP